jgi:hypothetical protein
VVKTARYVLLTTYLTLLVIAGWPRVISPPYWHWIVFGSEWALNSVSIIPGLKLFYRPYDEAWKTRGTCISVKGLSRDGRVEEIFKTRTLCDPPSFRFVADTEEILAFRLIEEAAMERFPDFSLDMNRREQALHRASGLYYCSQNPQLTHVFTGWERTAIEYKTGTKHSTLAFLAKFDCQTKRVDVASWFGFVKEEHAAAFLEDRPW